MRRHVTRKRAISVLVLLTAATMVAVGLSFTTGPANAAKSGAKAGGCNLAYVTAQINAAKALPKWKTPGPAFNAKKAAGKKIESIQENTANPFTENIVAGEKEAAAKVGIKLTDYANTGQTLQWVQGVNTALSAKVDGLLLSGGTIGPIKFMPQATSAHKAGIKIVTIVDRDLTQSAEPLTDARVGQPYAAAARLDIDWIIMQTKCKADVLLITANELIGGTINAKAAQDELAKYCGSACTIKAINVPVPDWSTKIQPIVQSSITANKNVNYVMPLYDAMSEFVVPAIQLAGAIGKVHVASFNGTPAILKMIETGDTVTMDVGENPFQLGYAGMDQIMRVMTGVKPIASGNESIPLRVFDKTNVKQAGSPPQFGVGYGTGWKQGYLKMWGLAK